VDVRRAGRVRSPPTASLARWARAALGGRGRGRRLALHVVTRGTSRRLNAQWRGKDRPTNVLAFPVAPIATGNERPIGDIVICADVVRAEARAQRKPLVDHWAHLVVHGALHLAGYDHERPTDAARMERREIAVLRGLGVPNPYAERPYAERTYAER
jgi:probable rRNA maturation factor